MPLRLLLGFDEGSVASFHQITRESPKSRMSQIYAGVDTRSGILSVWASLSTSLIPSLPTVCERQVMSQTDRLISLTALGIVMLYNELWNIVLFRWQNPFAGFLGVLAFLAPLLLLQVILLLVEPISGLLMLIYVLWVVLYDIPWSYALWKLNLPEQEKVDGSTSS
jgi:tryptophan-rich sensory protein